MIVLPAILLAGVGFYSLRQDRVLALEEATGQARRIAAGLAASLWPNAFLPEFPDPAVVTSFPAAPPPPETDPVFVMASRGAGPLAWLMSAAGQPVYPPPLAPAPSPQPLDEEGLNERQRGDWAALADRGFAANEREALTLAAERFLAQKPPPRFAAVIRYRLAVLYLRANAPDQARAWFELVAADESGAVAESGYPLKTFAELQLARLAAKTGAVPAERAARVNRLGAEWVFHPTPLSAVLLGQAPSLDPGATGPVSPWMKVWRAHEAARRLQALWTLAEPAGAPNGPWTLRARWLNLGGDTNWLAISPPGASDATPTGHWVAALPEKEVRRLLGTAIQSATLPEYLGVRVEIAGRRAWGETMNGRLLATESMPVQPVSPPGGEAARKTHSETPPETVFRLALYLIAPDALFARQRVRTLWSAALIAVSMGGVLVGWIAAWRSFRRQKQLSELKSGFVSSVSHELRAPIAAIGLMAEELEEIGGRDEVSREYHHLIKRECRRLAALIENVLDFSRHDQGRKDYHFASTDLVKLVEETVKVMQPHGAGSHLTIQTVIQGDPAPVEADGRALQQALVNLIDNAVKHSPERSKVTVGLAFGGASDAASREDSPARTREMVALWVEDQGPGIPPEEHAAIFERFYRRGSELRRETQGIGLGLAIVKYVTEAHGGTVQVRSAVGQGSRFTLELPIVHNHSTHE